MSDFDDIIKHKLDEEEAFPNMEANWARLSNRLAAAPPAKPLAAVFPWRRWAVAAAALLFIGFNSAFAFFAVQQYRENKRLQADVAQLKARYQPINNLQNTDTVWVEKIITRIDTVFIHDAPHNGQPSRWAEKKTGTPSVSKRLELKKAALPPTVVPDMPKMAQQSPLEPSKVPTRLVQTPPQNAIAAQDNASQMPLQEPNKGVQPTDTAQAVAQNSGSKTPVPPAGNALTTPTDSAQRLAQNVPTVSLIDSLTQQLDQKMAKQEPSESVPTKDGQGSKNQPIIKKLKLKTGLKALIGVNATVAIPVKNEEGFPQMVGTGVSAEVGVGDNWRVGGSVDFGRLTYDLEEEKYHYRERYRRWNLPREPMPFNRDTVLERIHGSQMRTVWSADVKYVFDEAIGVRPFVRVGYTMAKIESRNTQFEYKLPNTNEVLVQTRVQPTVKDRNIVQIGVGLEKELKHVNLYAQADYQTDFSATSFNLWVLKAGMKYAF